MKMFFLVLIVVSLTFMLSACAGKYQKFGDFLSDPHVTDRAFHMADNEALPYQKWGSLESPEAVVIAIHGFNDYHHAYKIFAEKAEHKKILLYAYDQRGFGGTSQRGIWASSVLTVKDLLTVTKIIKAKHPNVPVYWMGESMGGAIVMVASKHAKEAGVSGLVLSAPAVWGWKYMNPLYSFTLAMGNLFFPWLRLSGEGVKVMPSNNIEMLIGLGKDPMIIKKPRIDSIHGLVTLMSEAEKAVSDLTLPTLILYGGHDEIVPKRPVNAILNKMPRSPQGHWQTIYYKNGYHMLFRDLDGDRVIDDIFAWIQDKPLPSLEVQPNKVVVFDAHHQGDIPALASIK